MQETINLNVLFIQMMVPMGKYLFHAPWEYIGQGLRNKSFNLSYYIIPDNVTISKQLGPGFVYSYNIILRESKILCMV